MSKDNHNENIDKDIEQSREDVLRARDIIPSEKRKNSSQPSSSASEPDTGEKEQTSEIPSFDLSEHITNKHRRQASHLRKPPSQNRASADETTADSEKHVQTRLNSVSVNVPEERLIREIVARDIAEWYRNR